MGGSPTETVILPPYSPGLTRGRKRMMDLSISTTPEERRALGLGANDVNDSTINRVDQYHVPWSYLLD